MQFHNCIESYVLPDDTVCTVCPELDLIEAEEEHAGESEEHNDCHDCCDLDSCHETDLDIPALQTGQYNTFFAVIPTRVTVLAFKTATGPAISFLTEESLPNAPPSTRLSRGPPLHVNV